MSAFDFSTPLPDDTTEITWSEETQQIRWLLYQRGYDVHPLVIDGWSQRQRDAIEKWGAYAYLEASPHVPKERYNAGPMPAFFRKLVEE